LAILSRHQPAAPKVATHPFIVLEHQQRKVLHFGVTEHPTSEWVGQQVVEAFAERAVSGMIPTPANISAPEPSS
jgi:hypothetical protein